MRYTNRYESPLGAITMASDGENLTGLWFDGQKYFAAGLHSRQEERELPVFQQTKRWLDVYFQGKDPGFFPPISLNGSAFRREVWEMLRQIPYGQVTTYGEIARKIAQKHGTAAMSAQAVGGAMGHNPVSIMIPCHRVVGTNGSLTGYAGGIEKKIKLLALEKVDIQAFRVPKKGTAL